MAGFDCRIAIDIDPDLQSSYAMNFPATKALLRDIGAITESDWDELLGDERPDGIIGGPPCQGFSRMGKRDAEDPRNDLIGHYFRHISILRPKFFIMENVEGLLDEGTVDRLMTELQDIAKYYTVLDPMIIDASEFGAPTIRKRVVIVGYDADRVAPMTHADFMEKKVERPVTVRDAISDLPGPVDGTSKLTKFFWAPMPEVSPFELSAYAQYARALPPKGMGWAKAIENLSAGKISGLQMTEHTEGVKARYLATPPGTSDKTSKSYRLTWAGQCKTLRAGTGSDKGSFQAVRPLHPAEGRVITVREAARLQGFPDWFVFHPTKWHSFRMIGNSVSPIVSKALLEVVAPRLALRKAA